VPIDVAAGDSLAFTVTVTNHRTGHAIPSGTSFTREMWLDVTVRDADGTELYRSGGLAANGDLLPQDLEFFGSRLLDANNDPTFFTWRAVGIDESKLLQFGQSRVATYALEVPVDAVSPLSVDVKLRFRPLPPELLRILDLEHLGAIEIFEMEEAAAVVMVN